MNTYIKKGETATLTFGNRGENHVGNEMIGRDIPVGFTPMELRNISTKFTNNGYTVEYHDLTELLPVAAPPAAIIIIRDFLQKTLTTDGGNGGDGIVAVQLFYEEIVRQPRDTKYLDTRRGKVLNKLARHNNMYADFAFYPHLTKDPDYEKGKGTIIPFAEMPNLHAVQKALPKLFGLKAEHLICEGNYYYDINKCGIGWHGDTERKIVIAIRLGESMSLHYQWYQNKKTVGDEFQTTLNHGDLYIMSEKAVGNDWKKYANNLLTLRHSAGCKKYTDQ